VRFVDRHERRAQLRERVDDATEREPLRRDVDELQLARAQPGFAATALLGVDGRREVGGGDPARLERTHLVVHQRDERRDDHRRALEHDGRQLVTQGLAAARRRDDEHAARPVEQCVDRLALPRPEGFEAEALAQRAVEVVVVHGARIGHWPAM
jgi:hypothetical protein